MKAGTQELNKQRFFFITVLFLLQDGEEEFDKERDAIMDFTYIPDSGKNHDDGENIYQSIIEEDKIYEPIIAKDQGRNQNGEERGHYRKNVPNGNVVANGRASRITSDSSSIEPEGVFIPAPDYDEEEKTMVLEEEEGDFDMNFDPRRKRDVYREYQGEDFAQYLSDEDNGADFTQTYTSRPRRPPPQPFKHHTTERKPKGENKRLFKKRDAGVANTKHKKSPDKSISGSQSLRNFSYADSKFGTINGRNKRHSLPRSLSQEAEEADLFAETGSSYEQFLSHRNGDVNMSMDNDRPVSMLVDDRPFGEAALGLPERPPSYARQSSKKDTLWKKLTWRFKQPKHSFDLTS